MARFFLIFHALSFEFNLFFDRRFPLSHNINLNKVHRESRNCNTSDPENVAKTRDQSVLSDLSDSDFYNDNDEVLCTAEKQSEVNGE